MELKRVKCYDKLSEETICFTAELWEDGKHIGNLKNDGQGGSNNFTPNNGYTYNDFKKYDNLDTEYEIFEMVLEIDETRKKQTKGFYLKRNNKYYTTQFPMPITQLKKNPHYKTWLKNSLNQLKKQGYIVLNTNL